MNGREDEGPFSRGDVLLEQFEITRLIGVGGHAYVYECRDQFLDELLAVKVIPNPPNRGRELLNRARAEAQLLRKLSHPNVVRVYTAAALRDDMVCLVMEKLEGVSLRHLLALLSRLSVVEALSIVRQAAVGVGAAHQLDVVHRDIKPDNIFVLPPDNHVKVLDFGIAKFLGHGLQTSNKHLFQGTPLYMSPEHLKGAGVTVRSDVYQLGTVLFELLAGINPNLIDVDGSSFDQVAFVQITRPTPSLPQYVPGLPEYVDRLIQKATAKEPEARFSSMDEFVGAIDWTMAEYLRADPEAAARVRKVDPALVAAAKKLSALTSASLAHSATERIEVASEAVSGPPAVMQRSQEARAETSPSHERVASYHPIPTVARDGGDVSSHSSPLSAGQSPRSTLSGSHRLPIGWIITAIGFGLVAGLTALWVLVHRTNAFAAQSDKVDETAPATADTATHHAAAATADTATRDTAKPDSAAATPNTATHHSAVATPNAATPENAPAPTDVAPMPSVVDTSPRGGSTGLPPTGKSLSKPVLVMPVLRKATDRSPTAPVPQAGPSAAPEASQAVPREKRTSRVILHASPDEPLD